MAGPGLHATLLNQLHDVTPTVRLAAVNGLRRQADPAAAPALAELVGRELDVLEPLLAAKSVNLTTATVHANLVEAALRAAVEADASPAADVLLRAAALTPVAVRNTTDAALASAVYRLRRSALYGLGYVSGSAYAPRAIKSLARASRDAEPRLRAVAVRSLGVLGATETLTGLASLLGDPSPEVRWTAAEVFGLAGVSAATPALIKALDDSHALVRRAAAEALGYLARSSQGGADGTANDALRRLVKSDSDERVRQAAALALAGSDQ